MFELCEVHGYAFGELSLRKAAFAAQLCDTLTDVADELVERKRFTPHGIVVRRSDLVG